MKESKKEAQRRHQQAVKILPSVFAEELLRVEFGQHLHLELRPYLLPIYDSDDRYKLLAFGRQCEKSTTLANLSITHLTIVPEYKALYVVPSHPQLKIFSIERFNNVLMRSGDLSFLYSRGFRKQAMSVYDKQFSNLSAIHLRVAYWKPDLIRGIRADMVIIDELQDILVDHIPVIMETSQHSDIPEGKKFIFAGTFKTESDGLGYYWNISTQGEYAIKCPHCGRWNVPIDEKNIGSKTLICQYCGKPIHPLKDKHELVHRNPQADWFSIRVPQIIVPTTLNDWKFLLQKQKTYSPAKFYNEVLALPYDVSTRPITEEELRALCSDRSLLKESDQVPGAYTMFMGIDWGYGINSYTVVTLLGYRGGRFFIFFIKRYDKAGELDLQYQVEDIKKLIFRFRPILIGADWGGGMAQNQQLIKSFGEKYVQIYESEQAKAAIKWNLDLYAYIISRSQLHSLIFNMLKTGKYDAPKWDDFQFYAPDILAIETKYNESLRKIVYDHPVTKPDDFFHSLMYATIVAKLHLGEPFLT